MRRVRQQVTKSQRQHLAVPSTPSADLAVGTTPTALAMMQALIPLGLRAVEEALVAEVTALAGPR